MQPILNTPIGNASLTDECAEDKHGAICKPRMRKLPLALSSEQIEQFSRDGFLICKGLLKDGIEILRDNCLALRENKDITHPDNVRCELAEDGKPWKLDPFHDLHPAFASLVADRRILDPLASIYQGYEPRLFKSKLIMKPPGGHGTALHQDYNWWQGFPKSLINVTIAIDPATKENGCTQLFPRNGKEFLHSSGSFENMSEDDINENQAVYLETEPGDVIFFDCFVPHRAEDNASNDWRSQIFLTYNSAADGEHYFAHRDHYQWYTSRWKDEETQQRAFFR